MDRFLNALLVAAFAVSLMCFVAVSAQAAPALAGADAVSVQSEASPVLVAQGTTNRELEPRYEPVRQQPEQSSYNSGYMFALSRGVADSTLHPAAKAPFFLFTVPIDLVLIPFTAIGGFFG